MKHTRKPYSYIPLIFSLASFVYICAFFVNAIRTVPFQNDEISWFFHTEFFERAFIKHDLDKTFWTSYESFDHPQLSKYIFGGHLLLHDRDIFAKRDSLEEKWGRWDFYFSPQFAESGMREFSPYIRMMREVNGAFTVGTLVLLYVGILMVTGNMYVASIIPILLGSNRVFVSSMIRATSDSHMVFFVLLTLVLMNAGFLRKKIFGSVVLGFAIGCAVSTKLTGAIAIILYGLGEFTSCFFRQSRICDVLKQAVIVIGVASIIWYASNPGLYGNFLRGTYEYVNFRNIQSVRLERYFPMIALMDSGSRIHATFCTLLDPSCAANPGALTQNIYINGIGVFLGFVWLIKKSMRKGRVAQSTLMFIVVILTVNTAYLPLDSDRYYLLPIIAVSLVYAAGCMELWDMCASGVRRLATKNPA
jgi:hypothetical protein